MRHLLIALVLLAGCEYKIVVQHPPKPSGPTYLEAVEAYNQAVAKLDRMAGYYEEAQAGVDRCYARGSIEQAKMFEETARSCARELPALEQRVRKAKQLRDSLTP